MNYLPWLAGGAALGLAARRGRRAPVSRALRQAGIKAQDQGADALEAFLLDNFGTTEGHGGWTLQLQQLKERERVAFSPVEKITNPDGSIVYRGFHGTYRGLPKKEIKAFGGIHVGTERAARDRLADTSASAGMGPYGPRESYILPVEIYLSNPYGSFAAPVSEHDLTHLLSIPKRMEALKRQGHDGVIYRNAVEDRGEISVLAFYRRNVAESASTSRRNPRREKGRGHRTDEDDEAELRAVAAKFKSERWASRPFRIKFGAPRKGGRFQWLGAGPHSEIPKFGSFGYSYTRQQQLDHARYRAEEMVKVFARKYPGQGWVVGIFQGRKLIERFPVDATLGLAAKHRSQRIGNPIGKAWIAGELKKKRWSR